MQWSCPGGVWDGIIWSHHKIRPRGKRAAYDMVLYLLDELDQSDEDKLQDKIRELSNNDDYKLPPKLISN
jgi:hypothetical protein